MDLHPAASGFECPACGASLPADADPRDCPDCNGPLELAVAPNEIDPRPVSALAGEFLGRSGLGGLLGVRMPVALGQGETPLVGAPDLAELDVGSVAIKDKARNPSGSLADREAGCAVAAASDVGAAGVALPTTGAAGVAVAMAAARAGLDAHAFVPSRASLAHKAMTNVHGSDMTVVEGRYREAAAAYRAAESDVYPLAPFATPFRRAGVKPLSFVFAAARGWTAPAAVVGPTGQMDALVGIHRGFADLRALGLIDEQPKLIAAQAAACAPLADAVEAGADTPLPVEHPDTVVGSLEVSDPAGGAVALDAVQESGGTALAVDDEAILDGAKRLAEAGLPAGATGGTALAALRELAGSGGVDVDEDVVLVNPVAGVTEADLLRSHLLLRGG